MHCPLFPSTKHVVNAQSIAQMRDGMIIINTTRGGLMKSKALNSYKISAAGLDTLEGKDCYFYSDRSVEIIADDTFARFFTSPSVIVTGHQAFFTKETLNKIAANTFDSITAYIAGGELVNRAKE